MVDRYEFTEQQEKAIGELVVDLWGCNFQTGYTERGIPCVYAQRGPHTRVVPFSIDLDGTLLCRNALTD